MADVDDPKCWMVVSGMCGLLQQRVVNVGARGGGDVFLGSMIKYERECNVFTGGYLM